MIKKILELNIDKLVVYLLCTILIMLGGWVTLTLHNQSNIITELQSNLNAANFNILISQKTIDEHISIDRETTQHFIDQLNNRIEILAKDQKEILKLLIQIQNNI